MQILDFVIVFMKYRIFNSTIIVFVDYCKIYHSKLYWFTHRLVQLLSRWTTIWFLRLFCIKFHVANKHFTLQIYDKAWFLVVLHSLPIFKKFPEVCASQFTLQFPGKDTSSAEVDGAPISASLKGKCEFLFSSRELVHE